MNSAVITFSSGKKIQINEGDLLIPIVESVYKGKPSTSIDQSYEVWFHSSEGLIPSLTEFTLRCKFFHHTDSNKVYSVSAIVSIENI